MEPLSVTEGAAAEASISVIRDTVTFESRQAAQLRDLEQRVEAEVKRKKRNWERHVQKMR